MNGSIGCRVRFAAISAFLVLVGCGDGSPNLRLLDSPPGPSDATDRDAERHRLQSLQLVRFTDSEGDAFFMPTAGLRDVLQDGYCNVLSICPGWESSGGTCWTRACTERVGLCAARFLQSAALIRAEPLVLAKSYRLLADPPTDDLEHLGNYELVDGEVQIPPQSAATRAAILRLAVDVNRGILDNLTDYSHCENLDDAPDLQSSGAYELPWLPGSGTRASGLWAQVTVEAFSLAQELSEDAVDAVLAAADAQRSVSPTTAQGAARSIAGFQLSRAEAAHLLIGGSPGLLGDTSNAFCSSPELSGRAKAALGVLRRAAPDPDDVASESIDLGALLNSGIAGFPRGSVRVRLEALDGRPIVSSVEEHVGLSTEDFVQARSYLAQEIRTFARDGSVTFVAEALGEVPSTVFFHAATAREPAAPPPEYFAALTRYWSGSGPLYGLNRALVTATPSGEQFVHVGLSATLSNALGRVRQAIGIENGQLHMATTSDPADPTLVQFQGPLTLLADRDGRVGQLGWEWSGLPDGSTVFHADGYTADDNLRLVRGLSGLLCATTGRIEGEPCDATTLSAHTVVSDFPDVNVVGGSGGLFVGIGYATIASGVGLVDWDDPTPLFLVRPRDLDHEVPGGYDVLGGFSMQGLPKTGPGGIQRYRFPLFPELDRKAGEILRPSEKWCTRSAVECDGTLFDERMPLENELAEDNDDVESSWRHYLTLAEQAAEEAHLLGEQYLQNGLEVDRQLESTQIQEAQDRQRYLSRVEGEMETLQDICGTAMDTSDILALLGGQAVGPTSGTFCSESNGSPSSDCCDGAVGATTQCPFTCQSGLCRPNACASSGADSGCPAPYQCIGQRCVYSPTLRVQTEQSSREGLSRLRECIGDGTVVDYVALGSQPLCLWDGGPSNPTSICAGADEQYACPLGARRLPSGEYDCTVPHPPSVTNLKLVDVRLGLADAPSLIASLDPCHVLRARRGPVVCPSGVPCPEAADAADLVNYFERALRPLFLSAEHLLRADDLGWRVELPAAGGNASSLLVDGLVKWSTMAGGTQWPCSAYRPIDPGQPPIACPNADALFCQTLAAGCAQSTTAQRDAASRLNQRLLEAVAVLKGLGKGDFEDILVPFQGTGEPLGLGPVTTTDAGTYFGQKLTDGSLRIYDDPSTATATPPFWRLIELLPATQQETFTVFDVPAPDGPLTGRKALRNVRYDRTVFSQGILPTLFGLEGYEPLSAWTQEFNTYRPLPSGDGASPIGSRDTPHLTQRLVYTERNVKDAVELLCEVTRGDTWNYYPIECPAASLGALIARNDFEALREYGQCRITAFNRAVASMVLPRVPRRAIEGVRSFGVQGAFPVVGGQMGAQMLRLRAALTRYSEFTQTMAETGRQFDDVLSNMNLAIAGVGVRSESDQLAIEQAQAQGNISSLQGLQVSIKLSQIEFQQQAAFIKAGLDCADAAAAGVANAATSFGASLGEAAVNCFTAAGRAALEFENLTYESRITQVEGQIAAIQGQISQNQELINQNQAILTQVEHAREMIALRAQLRGTIRGMDSLITEAQAALDEIRASLAEIEGLRLRAQRSISRAMQFETTQAAVTENIESVLNSKLNVSKKRYLQAHKNAVRLSFLAKRAIEQRLGLHLSELRADMPLVEAPASWEAEICSAEGIDYEAIRAGAAESGTAPAVPVDFSGAYIGDYVTKLKNVVESYRLQYDFHEGTDEAIASLRDDVLNVRTTCEKFSGNRLKYSGELDQLVATVEDGGWQIEGCETSEEEGTLSTCLGLARITEEVLPGAPGFSLTWGGDATPETRLVQSVPLRAGRFRVSWYSPLIGASAVPELDVTLYGSAGQSFEPVSYSSPTTPAADLWTRQGAAEHWPRHYRFFDVPQEQSGGVAVSRSATLSGGTGNAGGLMLEMVSDIEKQVNLQLLSPPPFVATTDSLNGTVAGCQDTTGEAFRTREWDYRCTKLCTDGFSDNCLDSSLADRCYWETTFSLDQRELEAGRIFAQSGFARGNFNYRIEDVAVNFVGTELRDCSDSSLPSTCNAAGFVTYSLKHVGPLFVRNHTGGDFPIKLFNANIEHARGLGIERYLTNPISNTDRDLVTPYLRAEFNGRPLDGNFILRVWDEGGVNFDAIQDVQLYIKYRYWTRFD